MEADAKAAGKTIDEIEWAVPYLPVDPKDIGRSYEAVIRVNSQSGKGGVAYLLKSEHSLDLPRRAQIEFSGVIQRKTDGEGGEISSAAIWNVFQDEYLPVTEGSDHEPWGRFKLGSATADTAEDGSFELTTTLVIDGTPHRRSATGNGPINALVNILSAEGVDVRVLDFTEHALSEGGNAQAAAYVECAVGERVLWGVGVDTNTTMSSLKAVISAVNRAVRDTK